MKQNIDKHKNEKGSAVPQTMSGQNRDIIKPAESESSAGNAGLLVLAPVIPSPSAHVPRLHMSNSTQHSASATMQHITIVENV